MKESKELFLCLDHPESYMIGAYNKDGEFTWICGMCWFKETGEDILGAMGIK